ncbi:MAG: hypothetical protein D6813_00910 [Calditrichaeota bacterium]|nr:MAG: hypothetical protein D6813_00910 [Calditrichota bacterium]
MQVINKIMQKIKNILYIFTLLFLTTPLWSGDPIMPLREIKPGMRGVAKTVFAGNKIEEFQVEILDIIPNFRAKKDLILVKLLGDNVRKTGVVAGMSGSPVYIDGKLIGALSYRMGIFLKEPIAGVTPIEQMLDIFEREKVRDQELAAARGFNPAFVEMAVGVRELSWENFIPPPWQKLKTIRTENVNMTPLEIPLLLSGFESSAFELCNRLFSGLGFKVLQSGGTTGQASDEDAVDLEPGSAFSVVIVDGDFGLQATGTVTYRDGNKILGMGHPVFDTGAVQFPMGQAKILTTISSLMASTKMAALTKIVGTLHQDRTTGLLGFSGERPQMIPIKMSYRSEFQPVNEFHFRVAEDKSLYTFTPFILRLVLGNALESARLSAGDQTLIVKGKIALKNHEDIEIENLYAGGPPETLLSDALEATGDIAAIVGSLLSNDFEAPSIESISLNFTSLPKKSRATVQQIEVDKLVVKPGDEITVTVTLQEFQGDKHKIQHNLVIPENIDDRSITIYAGSGAFLTRYEFRKSPQKFRPQNFQQLLDLLRKRRKNNRIFFQIRKRDKGVLIEGEELPSLPPSILSVMNSQRSSGNVSSLIDRKILEDSVPVNFAVSGGKIMRIRVEPKEE